jgi:hypothetical protein
MQTERGLSVSGSSGLPLEPTEAGRATMGECDPGTAPPQRLTVPRV